MNETSNQFHKSRSSVRSSCVQGDNCPSFKKISDLLRCSLMKKITEIPVDWRMKSYTARKKDEVAETAYLEVP